MKPTNYFSKTAMASYDIVTPTPVSTGFPATTIDYQHQFSTVGFFATTAPVRYTDVSEALVGSSTLPPIIPTTNVLKPPSHIESRSLNEMPLIFPQPAPMQTFIFNGGQGPNPAPPPPSPVQAQFPPPALSYPNQMQPGYNNMPLPYYSPLQPQQQMNSPYLVNNQMAGLPVIQQPIIMPNYPPQAPPRRTKNKKHGHNNQGQEIIPIFIAQVPAPVPAPPHSGHHSSKHGKGNSTIQYIINLHNSLT